MVGRRLVAALVVLLALLVPADAAAPVGEDVTGDVTDPVLVGFSITPTAADVTAETVRFDVTVRVTDDFSGVNHANVGFERPNPQDGGFGFSVVRQPGSTERDATFKGFFEIWKGSPPGTYKLHVSANDRVGNGFGFDADELEQRGFPGRFEVTNRDPDVTAPTISDLRLSTTAIDVRGGAQTFTIEVDAADTHAGVYGMTMFVTAPDGSGGGADLHGFQLTSGTAASGTWTGRITIPQYAPRGRWTLYLGVIDRLINRREYRVADLEAAGLPSGIDVESHEDSEPPRLVNASVWPIEVNVHDADQVVRVQLRVTDDLSGVLRFLPDRDEYAVYIDFHDELHGQATGGGLRLTSGTVLDGTYARDFVIPKSSATGLRRLRLVGLQDEVGNQVYVFADEVVAKGGAPAILVYNTPLPPVLREVLPADSAATVRWDPPVDDRGAAVTQYVIREATKGVVGTVSGTAREAVVHGLANGARHTLTVEAVNKAGASDPSNPGSVVPMPAPAAAPSTPTPGVPRAADAPAPPAPRAGGYWMTTASGEVYAFGDATWLGNTVAPSPTVDLEPTPSRGGYWTATASGQVHAFGDASVLGAAPALRPFEAVTSLSSTPSGQGYWLFTTAGRVFAYGDAPWLGDMAGTRLNGPVLDSVPTPSGRGYYMVASDGGVFTFGDATFRGSMGGMALNQPVQSLVPDADGDGYWLVASDGGIFSFGAPFHGSMGDTRLNRPVTGMVASPTGAGYLMVAEDGGIFTFGDVPFHGSLGSTPPRSAVVSAAAH